MPESGEKSTYTWVVILVVILLVVVGILMAMKKRKTGSVYGGKEMLLLPAGRGPHTHSVDLDETGFGISSQASNDDDHRHVVEKTIDIGLVKDGDVAPADHHHDLTAYMVDA